MKTLVTGSASGIGRYLLRELSADGFSRLNNLNEIINNKYDLIIHCATNHCRDINSQNIVSVYEDNLFLSYFLASITNPETIFIFFSSIDVYQTQTEVIFDENEVIAVDQSQNLYGITKLMGEGIVRKLCKRYIILRPGLLIGEFMRPNSISKVIAAATIPAKISLTSDSEFYVISYEEVTSIIKILLQRSAWGTYNILHSDVITLAEVAEFFNTEPQWGSYRYHRPKISNLKIIPYFPTLTTPPINTVKNWSARYF